MNLDFIEQQMNAYRESIQITENPFLDMFATYCEYAILTIKQMTSAQLKWQQDMNKIIGVNL